MAADQQHDDHDPFGPAASDPKAPIDAGDAFLDDSAETAAVPQPEWADAPAPLDAALDDADADQVDIDASDAPEVDADADALDDSDEPAIDDPEAPTAEELDAAQAELDAAAAREEQLTRLFTATIMGPGEERIGKVGQVYLDDQSQEPNWVTAKTGLFGTKEFFIPLDDAQLDGKHIIVPYTKADVTTAPVTEIDQNLSPDEEDALYNHYRVPGRMTIDPEAAPATDEFASFDPAEGGASADARDDDPIEAPAPAPASIESVIDEAPAIDEPADEAPPAEGGYAPLAEPHAPFVEPHAPLAEPHAPLAEPHASPEPAPSPFAPAATPVTPADPAPESPAVEAPTAEVPAPEVSDATAQDAEAPDAEAPGQAPDYSPFRRPES